MKPSTINYPGVSKPVKIQTPYAFRNTSLFDMKITPHPFIRLTCALLVTLTALMFCVTAHGQYFEQPGDLLHALNSSNRQVFDVSPDGKIAIALKSGPTSMRPVLLTTFDPILGTQFDNEIFATSPVYVRLAKVGDNLRAVVQTAGGRTIYLFDVSPTGQLTQIASTQLTTSGADAGSNLALSGNGAVGFVIVVTESLGADIITFSLNDGAIIKRFPVSHAPDTIALYENPNTRLLAFRLGDQVKVLNVLDPSQPVEIASVPLVSNNESFGFPDDGIAFSGDGRYVFFTNQFFNFAAIDLNSKQIVGTIPAANFRFSFVESFEGPQQRILAVGSLPGGTTGSSALLLVDATNPSQMVVLKNVSPAPGRLVKFSNDGSLLFAADDTVLRAMELPSLATAWEQPAPDSVLRVHQLQVYGPSNDVMGAWSAIGDTSFFGSFPAFPPNVSLGDSTTVNEDGSATASFTVSLSAPTTHRLTIKYTTSGTAQTGSDFTSPSSSLVIEPGATSGTINIPILEDTLDEADETINLNISSDVGVVTRAQSTATILDNDLPPSASIGDAIVVEGDFFNSFMVFQVTLSAVSGQNISLAYSTVAGTATGTDFTVTSGNVTIAPGQTVVNINILLTPDRLSEDDETFSVILSNPTNNVTFTKATATGTIVNNDAPLLAFAAPSQRAIALDAVLLTAEPFALNNPNYFGADKRTRISIFTLNLILTPGLVITAQGVDSQQVVHQLPVEFVGNVPGFNPVVPQQPFLTQIVLRLPDGLTSAGDLQVRVTARGRNSNEVLIAAKP